MQMCRLALLAASYLASASAIKFISTQGAAQAVVSKQTPMAMVVTLITELEAKIQADGKKEGQSYDKNACWCENTLARKAGDISEAKTTIEDAQTLITKLKGEIATHGAEIENLNKAIAANLESRREATDARQKEKADYTGEKTESEQCIGALEAAIGALSGAGTGKSGFLETMKEAELLSVVGGVRGILGQPLVSRVVSTTDMNLVKNFVDRPEDFVGSRRDGMSALQIAQNPFGDYAPKSTQIQGILKSMYDAFAADLEKANAEESEETKSFDALMATKAMELNTLQITLEHHTVGKAEKEKLEAQTRQLRDDTQAQLDADEKFFADTKAACQTKAKEWAERTRLRTEELQGMRKAIQILSSPSSQRTFENATTTLLQESSTISDQREGLRERARTKAFQRLRSVAGKFHSLRLAKVVASLRTKGHFDKVIAAINQMMEVLRKEEQDDIDHRDRCQVSTGKNVADLEDLKHSIDKSEKALEVMTDEKNDLKNKVSSLEAEINATTGDMEELLELRNKATADFRQALKDDNQAIDLLNQAIVSLSKFYKNNKIASPLLLQKQAPEYTVDEDKMPETTWGSEGGDYGGDSSGASGGILAILTLIKEDMEMELKTGRSDDATAQSEYEEQRGAMQSSLDTSETTKTATETALADKEAQMQEEESAKSKAGADRKAEDELQTSLFTDCSWVETHFETRRSKRKEEMAGLTDASSYLAGVAAGDEV